MHYDIPFDKTIQNVVTLLQAHTSACVDTEKVKKLVFLTRQLELLLQKQFSMNDYCFALQSYPKCNYEQLRDFLVLPCKRKLQYITSSIDKDQLGSSSQPASLELHLTSLSSGGSHSDDHHRGPASQYRRVASASSVVTSCALSSDSISSACASAPQSSRRTRGVGLEAELAGVRVEVAGLVQQRHHLAVCVSRLQKQLDVQLVQWNGWEKALRKYIAELEGGEKTFEDLKKSSSSSAVKSACLAEVSFADDVFCHNMRSFSSETSLASQVLQPSTTSSMCLLSPVANGGEAAADRDVLAAADACTASNGEGGVDASGPGRPDRSAGLETSDMSEESISGVGRREAGEVSEESSCLHESPRKPPSDLLSLLSLLRSAVRALLEKEALKRQAVEEELNSVEKQKAEISDKLMQLHTELQGVRSELDKSEEYWLLKLQDEQDYYEEERRVYDDKFAELEAKIVAYETEELNKNTEGSKQRLSPIDESIVFEQQVNELEMEVLEAQRLQAAAEAERDQAVELQRLAEEQLATLWLEIEKTETKESTPMNVDDAYRSPSVENMSLKGDDEKTPLPELTVDQLEQLSDARVDSQEFKSSGGGDLKSNSRNLKLGVDPCVNNCPSKNAVAVNGDLQTAGPVPTRDAEVQTQLLLSLDTAQPCKGTWDEETSSGQGSQQLQQTEVLRQLHESCRQLHAAQHTATLARTQLEALHSRMEEHVEKTLAATADQEGRGDLVPVASLAAVIKGSWVSPVNSSDINVDGCREQQKLQVLELERALADAHHHLQHHASQHTQQVRRVERADKLLAELFMENSELMRALHLTEARQKRAEQQLRSIK
ncbi:hypothetical protein FHG87_012277 [Trinorchestia longiramus]|nr:hypothetical protein FHG87_012277 [Trinorchestia longiramus]